MAQPVNMMNIGKTGLMTTKAALTTTSHNIANANTEGFSRQSVEQTANAAVTWGKNQFGNGVTIKDVRRANDEYLNRRINVETRNHGLLEEKDLYLHQTEQVFNESTTDGMNAVATKFYNEFRKLSTDPHSEAMRASVRESSVQLSTEINRMSRDLKEVQKNIDARIEGYVREVNALSKEIRDLNIHIMREELAGNAPAPDLNDKRDLAMKKLSTLADVSISKDKNNQMVVTLAGHAAIVNGEQLSPLEVARSPADPSTGKAEGRLDIVVKDPTSSKFTQFIKAGRLGGLLEVRDQDIARAQKQLDDMAYRLATEVNNIHAQGFGRDGLGGRNFFNPMASATDAAAQLKVSDEVVGNLNAIAAAKEPLAASDNRIAIAISGLANMKSEAGAADQHTMLDQFNAMVGELAVKTGASQKSLSFQKDVLTQIENVREALVGVSLDEETANLIRFQHAYAANAKVMQVADETLKTVLGMFG